MNFSKLPFELQVHVEQLVRDKQFQKRFAEDQVLDQLDQLKYDPFIEARQQQLLFGNKLKFYGIEFENLTLSMWGFLYAIKSPIIEDKNVISDIDLNLFFYLLQTKDYNLNLVELMKQSFNYTQNVLNLTLEQAKDVFQKIIRINFRVLNMFPRLKAEKKAVFNADWITSIVTKVVQVCTYSTQELYKNISMCQIYYLFAQYCREKGSEAIFLRTEEEIVEEEDLRASTLVVERLIQLGHITEQNKSYYIDLIHNIGKDTD